MSLAYAHNIIITFFLGHKLRQAYRDSWYVVWLVDSKKWLKKSFIKEENPNL